VILPRGSVDPIFVNNKYAHNNSGFRFPRGKARPGRDADHSPPSNAEVENE
jgi:hypothetical protein